MSYEIELITLKCLDAQEGKDEVSLYVNGNRAWHVEGVGTGMNILIGQRVPFDHDVTVRLNEVDVHRDDTIGTDLHLGERDVYGRLNGDSMGPWTHTFSWRKTRTIDAIYQLTYNLHQI